MVSLAAISTGEIIQWAAVAVAVIISAVYLVKRLKKSAQDPCSDCACHSKDSCNTCPHIKDDGE